MAAILNSKAGKVWLLDANPRQMTDSSFNRLCESVERDPEFLMARGVVVWQVPDKLTIPDGEKCPFVGQEGKLVVIGGNMRCRAFKALGYKDIKDEWLVLARNPDGTWWDEQKAARFVLVDNSPEGIGGRFDDGKLLEQFSEFQMRMAGIDFSGFLAKVDEAGKPEVKLDTEDDAADEAEEGEYGEKNPELEAFKKERETTRRDLKEMDDTGFYLILVFDGVTDKIEFIQKAGLTGDKKVARVDGDCYLVLVFESYAQKTAFIEKAGLSQEDERDAEDGHVMYGKFCDGRYLAKKMGIELAETGLHFRDRVVDNQLADMAREDAPQKSDAEIMEEQFAKLKAERAELGMGGGSGKKGRTAGGDYPDDDLPPADVETEDAPENGNGVYVADDDGEESVETDESVAAKPKKRGKRR